jgi:hypothetical protein
MEMICPVVSRGFEWTPDREEPGAFEIAIGNR